MANDLSPFIKVGAVQGSMKEVNRIVIEALDTNNFEILGRYNPKGVETLKVIVFTRDDIKNTVVKVKDRGALAAAMKIGLQKQGNKIIVSYVNPEYIFRAYLRDDYDTFKPIFDKIQNDLKAAMRALGNDFTPFGGKISAKKLANYRYKITMPDFTRPIVLAEYNDFTTMFNRIIGNLKDNNETKIVYSLVYPDKKIAVIGIGLIGKWTNSESYFLERIGEEHLAALPYEIILQDNKVTMLHGKYRFALFWPDLSLKVFMRIMCTPKQIRKTFEQLTSYSGNGI